MAHGVTRGYASFGWALLRWVGVAMATFLVVLSLLNPPLSQGQPTGNDLASTYLQMLGTVYAVVLAFVVFVVWDQFNEARRNLEHEANELMDLLRLGGQPPFPSAHPVAEQIDSYVLAVLDDELGRPGDASQRAEEALHALWRTLVAVEATGIREQILVEQSLARFEELADLRTYRLLSAVQRLPWGLRWVVHLGGVLVVGSMGFFTIASFWLLVAMALFLAVTIALVLGVVADLDDPFGGAMRVPDRSLRMVRHAITRTTPVAAEQPDPA